MATLATVLENLNTTRLVVGVGKNAIFFYLQVRFFFLQISIHLPPSPKLPRHTHTGSSGSGGVLKIASSDGRGSSGGHPWLVKNRASNSLEEGWGGEWETSGWRRSSRGRGTVWSWVEGVVRGRQRRHTGICIHVPKLRRRARLLVVRAHTWAHCGMGVCGGWMRLGVVEMSFSFAFMCITHIIHVQWAYLCRTHVLKRVHVTNFFFSRAHNWLMRLE